MTIRERLAQFSRARTDSAAVHAVLIWLDSLPPEVVIAAMGKRQGGMSGPVTDGIPPVREWLAKQPSTAALIDSDERLARTYWEHPGMIFSGGGFPDA